MVRVHKHPDHWKYIAGFTMGILICFVIDLMSSRIDTRYVRVPNKRYVMNDEKAYRDIDLGCK